jgi:hypothetical protein
MTPRKRSRVVAEVAPLPPIRVIPPDALFRLDELRALLGLPVSCLKREIRLRRLRVSKRSGRYWCTGEWVREWIETGEVRQQARADAVNGDGHAGAPGRA